MPAGTDTGTQNLSLEAAYLSALAGTEDTLKSGSTDASVRTSYLLKVQPSGCRMSLGQIVQTLDPEVIGPACATMVTHIFSPSGGPQCLMAAGGGTGPCTGGELLSAHKQCACPGISCSDRLIQPQSGQLLAGWRRSWPGA